MNKEITFVAVWFTFKRDAKIVRESVLSFKKHRPHIPCVIADDSSNPFDDSDMSWINETDGVFYVQTDFKRMGNLNGTECISGILNVLNQSCEEHKASHAIKIDSDTMFIKTDWMNSIKSDTKAFGVRGGGRNWYGLFYVLRSDVALSVKSKVDDMELNRQFPEDRIIGSHVVDDPDTIVHDFDPDGGVFCGYDSSTSIDRIKDFEVINISPHFTMEEKLKHMKDINKQAA